MEVAHYQMAHHLHLKEEVVMNMQLHITVLEVLHQIYIINMEMQHMKQKVGIQTALTLSILVTHFSGAVEIIIGVLAMRAYSTSTTTVGSSNGNNSFRLALVV